MVRIRRCPVCNGKMEYKAFDYFTRQPKNVCNRCGYSGSFQIEWDDDSRMSRLRPARFRERCKEATRIEDSGMRGIAGFWALLVIITSLFMLILFILDVLDLL